jgi:hypothetical protein
MAPQGAEFIESALGIEAGVDFEIWIHGEDGHVSDAF